MHITLCYYHINQYVAAGNHRHGFFYGVTWVFQERICGIDDMSGPIRLHHLLQVCSKIVYRYFHETRTSLFSTTMQNLHKVRFYRLSSSNS